MTGLTAWIGVYDILRPSAGDTVLVTAAGGAVGSLAAQLAKRAGARVIGTAGGAEKCDLLTTRLGLDALAWVWTRPSTAVPTTGATTWPRRRPPASTVSSRTPGAPCSTRPSRS